MGVQCLFCKTGRAMKYLIKGAMLVLIIPMLIGAFAVVLNDKLGKIAKERGIE